MDQIEQSDMKAWKARHVETSTKQMAINREYRIVALNQHTRDTADFPWRNWSYVGCFNIADGTLCLCGNIILSASILKHKSGQRIQLGSQCIERVRKHYAGTEFEDEANKFSESLSFCPTCKSPKVQKYQYCGEAVCVRCKHGLRKYYKGKTKQSKPFAAWFCPCVKKTNACKPIFVPFEQDKPRIKSGGFIPLEEPPESPEYDESEIQQDVIDDNLRVEYCKCKCKSPNTEDEMCAYCTAWYTARGEYLIRQMEPLDPVI